MIYLKRRLINIRIRYCSRAFIINKENKILLQRFEFPQINEKDAFKGLKWWAREELLSLNSDEYEPIEILNYI